VIGRIAEQCGLISAAVKAYQLVEKPKKEKTDNN
jgi:hypothetical protein